MDGLILTVADARASPALDAARAAGVPVVLMFNEGAPGVAAAAVDNAAAAAEVAGHLLEAGRRRIGFVAGRSRRRFEGLDAALAATGAAPPTLLAVSYTRPDHRAEVAALLDAYPRLDALFCSNDMLALSVIDALRALGRRVPEDLAVVGFDGIAVGRLVAPLLAIPNVAMGEAAARLLDEIRENTGRVPRARLPFEFRPGGTLAPPERPWTSRRTP